MRSVDDFLIAFDEVIKFFRTRTNVFLNTIYGKSEWSYLFYCALLPVVLAFVFDLVMSFILSFRLREIKLFNCFSASSWRLYSDSRNKYNNRSISDARMKPFFSFPRFTRLNMFMILKFRKFRSGDVIYSRDGLKATYLGMRLKYDEYLYAYKTINGIYYSRLSPKQFIKSSGSQRINNTVESVRISK